MQDYEFLQQVKSFCQKSGYVSVSALQRKFLLYHSLAQQLVEDLIQEGFCEENFTISKGYLILQ